MRKTKAERMEKAIEREVLEGVVETMAAADERVYFVDATDLDAAAAAWARADAWARSAAGTAYGALGGGE